MAFSSVYLALQITFKRVCFTKSRKSKFHQIVFFVVYKSQTQGIDHKRTKKFLASNFLCVLVLCTEVIMLWCHSESISTLGKLTTAGIEPTTF